MQKDAVVVPFRKRRRFVALVAAAAVAAGVAVTTAVTGSGGSQHGTQAQGRSASAFLDDTAEVASVQSAGSGQYWKMQTGSGTGYISKSMKFTYRGAGGGTRPTSNYPGWSFGAKTLDWNGVTSLTTDPTTLRRILAGTRQGKWEEDPGTIAFEDVSVLLGDAPTSPQQRAALLRALAGMKGVTIAGTTRDADGRTGTKVSYHGKIGVTSMIIDPKTSAVLQIDKPWTSARDDQRTTIISSGLTDKIG